MTDTRYAAQVRCIDCSKEITWAVEEDPAYVDYAETTETWWDEANPTGRELVHQFRCIDCARKVDPYNPVCSCYHCGALFQGFLHGNNEACSRRCGDAIDEMVERSIQSQYDAIERRLEAL